MFFAEVFVAAMLTAPPDAEIKNLDRVAHGVTRSDPYAWLRGKEKAQVRAYLEAENTHADAVTNHLESFRQVLYDEMLGRIKEDDTSVPWAANDGWTYFTRTEEGKPYHIICRSRGEDGDSADVIFDINQAAKGHEFYEATQWEVSPDGMRLAWLSDTSGYESCDLYVKDLATGEIIDDTVHEADPFTLAWGDDNETVFFARVDEAKRSDRIYRHRVGTPAAEDVLVFHDPDGRFYVEGVRGRSGESILIESSSTLTSEWHHIDAAHPTQPASVILPRRQGVEYDVERHGDRWFIRTNDAATNFRVVTMPLGGRLEDAAEFIPHDPDVYITGIDVFKNHLVVSERRGGYTSLRVIDLADGNAHLIEVPEVASVIRPSRNERFDTSMLRFEYQSPITPSSTYDYDLVDRSRTLRKQREVLGGFDPSRYTTRRLEAISHDGVIVPITLVHRADLKPDGTHPLWLYGYGSYGSSMNPWFSSNRLSLLNRGVVFAIAHVRGGGEMGRHWYDTGKMEHKQNTFLDFIAAAEAIRDQGWADPDRIAIEGGSAGGLLIGAVLNMRPDLFKVAHASVPFVDVVTTMSDASIPLTVGEYEEWGNPSDEEAFHWMLAYSPYDNVADQDYPAILVTAGLNDPRVPYWEPAKWTARLRDFKTDDNPLILRTNMGAGHGGASGRYGRLGEIAFEYAFMLDQLQAKGEDSSIFEE